MTPCNQADHHRSCQYLCMYIYIGYIGWFSSTSYTSVGGAGIGNGEGMGT